MSQSTVPVLNIHALHIARQRPAGKGLLKEKASAPLQV